MFSTLVIIAVWVARTGELSLYDIDQDLDQQNSLENCNRQRIILQCDVLVLLIDPIPLDLFKIEHKLIPSRRWIGLEYVEICDHSSESAIVT